MHTEPRGSSYQNRRLAVLAGIGAVCAVVFTSGCSGNATESPETVGHWSAGVTAGDNASASDTPQVKDDDRVQPGIEEDFTYPGADKIFAERGIRLLKGDGHILLVECDNSAGLVKVWSPFSTEPSCFRVIRAPGLLTLELPEVYGIRAGQQSLAAVVTINGTTETISVEQERWAPVGVGANMAPATLIELRASD